MAFDPARRKTVLFGGTNPDRGNVGMGWTVLDPSVRHGAGAPTRFRYGVDNASQQVMLFSGAVVSAGPGVDPGAIPAVLGDTWQWDGENWTQRPVSST